MSRTPRDLPPGFKWNSPAMDAARVYLAGTYPVAAKSGEFKYVMVTAMHNGKRVRAVSKVSCEQAAMNLCARLGIVVEWP